MFGKLKHLLVGSPLPTGQQTHERLNKIRALAAFAPGALSSLAYANQEIYLGLAIAGSAGLRLAWPIGAAITLLLIIVAISYYQTIYGYPSGGGSYLVGRDNLGTLAGLIAGAALLIDYLLTAAVSLTAGVDAIASAFPVLWDFRVPLALTILAVITLANLRGLRETGTLMAVPVYFFLFAYLGLLGIGLLTAVTQGPGDLNKVAPFASHPLTLLLILRAFSTGCTALTGIEAISNCVPVFKAPEARNAGQTLIVMAVFMALLFLGSLGLIQFLAVTAGPQETILSALTRRLVGNGLLYYLVQFSILAVLAVAANTSFAGFPRLVAYIASDNFLPRQLTNLGDRLVYTNGILSLSLATGGLIVLFNGDTHALIPLFAIGVFVAFTISQAGMVRHWHKEHGQHWLWKSAVNGLGAVATGITTLVLAFSKFTEGAWLVALAMPLIVVMFYRIRGHYRLVSRQLSLKGLPPSLRPYPTPRVVIPISGVHRGIIDAVDFARGISQNVTALYIEIEPGKGEEVAREWERWFPEIPLVVRPSPYRSLIQPLLDFLDETDEEHNDGQLAAVILPEFIPARWWHSLLHNQSSWLIKTALLYRRRHLGYQRVIIDIPYHLKY